jgi:AraC-like DNA-binding protein
VNVVIRSTMHPIRPTLQYPPSVTWIRAAATRAVLAAAESRGLRSSELLRLAKVAELPPNALATIPLSVHFGVIAAGMKLTDDPSFILDVARDVPVETYDVVGFAMRSAPDFGSAAEVARRYQALYTESSIFEVERSSRGLRVWFKPSGPLPLAARCGTESAVAQMVVVGRQLCGPGVRATRVAFRHPPPRSTSAHDRFFGVTVEWNAPLAELACDAEVATLPVLQADPGLHDFLVRTAEAALAAHRSPATLVDQARRVAAELLPSGKLSIDTAASRLGMSTRTLRRRLQEHGTSFLELRDAVRLELSKRYLEERSLPLAEIAFLLDSRMSERFGGRSSVGRALPRRASGAPFPPEWPRESPFCPGGSGAATEDFPTVEACETSTDSLWSLHSSRSAVATSSRSRPRRSPPCLPPTARASSSVSVSSSIARCRRTGR